MVSQRIRFARFFGGLLLPPGDLADLYWGALELYLPPYDWHRDIDREVPASGSFFQLFGFDGIPVWIGDPRTVRMAIGSVVIWQSVGFYMVLFLAAMEAIPDSFYEAAIIDGANRWHQF